MTMRTFWSLILTVAVMAVVGVCPAFASGGPPRSHGPVIPTGQVPEELEGIGIVDKPGADVPRDIVLTGSDGRELILGEYLDDERPLILVFAYYGCPMLCSLVLNGTMDVLKAMPENAGNQYRVLVVTFDPRDKVEVAKAKRQAYVEAYGRPVDEKAFEFALGSETEVARLADSVGFRYRWSEAEKQYAHAAGIFVITPKGKLSQALTGIRFEANDVSGAVAEAKKGVWHSPLKSALLYCFQFNPRTGKYVLAAGRAMQVGAAITVAGLTFLLFRLLRGGRSQKAAGETGHS
ncbi:MAG: SCO family protein [Polyangiaceae bacterium]|nr:SCO family protein [Polyangiaceae bacterium]